jgi:hypothetical protein
MTEFPEIERLRYGSWEATLCKETGVPPYECPVPYACEDSCSTYDVALVRLADAERAVRDAVERNTHEMNDPATAFLDWRKRVRKQAVRECVDTLRGEAARQADRYYAPIYFGRCADFIERTLLGEGEA